MTTIQPTEKRGRGRPKGSFKKHPKLGRHKRTNQGRVIIDSKDIYLGDWGPGDDTHPCEDVKCAYDRVLGEYLLSRRTKPGTIKNFTVTELLAGFWSWAEGYFIGHQTQGLYAYRNAVRLLRQYYGPTQANDFGPLALQNLMRLMVGFKVEGKQETWSRRHVNGQMHAIRYVFRWADRNELVRPGLYASLKSVPPLKLNQFGVRETAPRGPVDTEVVQKTWPFMPEPIATMVKLEALTGMRPGEVCRMRGCDINFDGPLVDGVKMWVYRPYYHKTMGKGFDREVHIGRRGQDFIRPFLKADVKDYIFNQTDMLAWEPQMKTAAEHTRHLRRQNALRRIMTLGEKRLRRPRNAEADWGTFTNKGSRFFEDSLTRWHFTPGTYYMQVRAAVNAADAHYRALASPPLPRGERAVPAWTPYQLRHRCAHDVRDQFGEEAVRVILGHQHLQTTGIYLKRDRKLGGTVMAEVG